jgi:predicted amidohydrolase
LTERRIAAAQYPISYFHRFDEFRDKLTQWVARAASADAELLVFPEYGSMELASLFPTDVQQSLPAQLLAMQDLLEDYLAAYRLLAREHRVHILAGSFPVRVGERYHNRAYLFSPGGEVVYQDKVVMTRFEAEHWGISSGDELRVFDTAIGKIGVTICYDVEFPMLARAQAAAGAEIVLAPSCTDTEAGYYRVRIGAQARALENQCHVVQAVTVGRAEWSEAVDVNVGAAALYGPVDTHSLATGVAAMGERDQPDWVFATADLRRAEAVRRGGQVLNARDWPRQLEPAAAVRVVDL